jgi:predicted TIM-barrel fold metal-dependent hydrolase
MWAQVLYPNLVAFQTFALMDADPEVARLVIRAYNDYLVEWSSPASERFALISMVPFWDIDETIAEMTRCREIGHHGVLWAMTMPHHNLPPVGSDHWDRVYAAAQDLEMSMSFHIATGETEGVLATLAAETDSRNHVKSAVPIGLGNANAIAEVITSEVCHKFPRLAFVSVESGFGYLPYVLELMDWQWKTGGGPKQFPHRLLPSEYFRRQVYSMFWFEIGTLDLLEQYQDNVMFESDFPHPTSLTPTQYTVNIPGPEELVNAHLERYPEDVMRKVMHDNAARVYHLD